MKSPVWDHHNLRELFSQDELDEVCTSTLGSRKHPFGKLLTQAEPTATQMVTEHAYCNISQRDPAWLKSCKSRLMGNDYSSVSAALAELRTYGALLSAFHTVEPVPVKSGKTPDFKIVLTSVDTVFVEVHAKQWHQPEFAALDAFLQTKPPHPEPGCHISASQHAIRPFGQPKKTPENHRNELIVENMISRIAAIKERDEQIPEDVPSVLWLDFQDTIWDGFMLSEQLFPTLSWHGTLSSGGLWHAFYGRKGARLMENSDVCVGAIGGTARMQHEGRFYQIEKNHRAAGVIVSLPQECVLLENPNARNPLPQRFAVQALNLPWFRLQKCWLDWPRGALGKRIELIRNEIAALVASPPVG